MLALEKPLENSTKRTFSASVVGKATLDCSGEALLGMRQGVSANSAKRAKEINRFFKTHDLAWLDCQNVWSDILPEIS